MRAEGSVALRDIGRHMKLTSHLYLVPILRMRGTMSPVAWCVIKHRNNIIILILYVSTTVFITQGNYVGYMFRLMNSHLQAYSLQVKSQDAVHTLGSQCVYISEILKPYQYMIWPHHHMMWCKYFTDVNTMGFQCCAQHPVT